MSEIPSYYSIVDLLCHDWLGRLEGDSDLIYLNTLVGGEHFLLFY